MTFPVNAQYPERPVRLLIPYSAGGGNDYVARLINTKLPERLGATVVIDNRPGASGLTGTELVARAPADGYTILMSDSSFTINVAFYPQAKYKPLVDFVPITLLADTPYLLLVHPGTGFSNLKDLIAAARTSPGRINLGSAGNGSGGHLAGELFQQRANVKLNHIPYKGSGPATNDVVAGQIQATFASAPGAVNFIKAGRIRALAAGSAARSPTLPDVPTFVELGYKDLVVTNWFGIVGVAGTPQYALDKLHQAFISVVQQPEIRENLKTGALEPITTTPAEFRKIIDVELVRWAGVVKAAESGRK